jgi:hypothetical protein
MVCREKGPAMICGIAFGNTDRLKAQNHHRPLGKAPVNARRSVSLFSLFLHFCSVTLLVSPRAVYGVCGLVIEFRICMGHSHSSQVQRGVFCVP